MKLCLTHLRLFEKAKILFPLCKARAILDTSPGLQYSSINAVVSVDSVLMVTTLDRSDMEGTKRMTQDLYRLFERTTEVISNKVPFDFLILEKQESWNRFNCLWQGHTVFIWHTWSCRGTLIRFQKTILCFHKNITSCCKNRLKSLSRTTAINNLDYLLFKWWDDATVKKSEINPAISRSEARNDDERNRWNGFWQTR